jgi:type II secretory pathway component PulF
MATEAIQTTYLWQGTDKNGNKTKGEIQGSSQAPVKAQLRKQGVSPTKVKRKAKDLFGSRKQKIKPSDIAVFTRQLATMMKSGIPLVQSFEIVGESLENPSMRELVGPILNSSCYARFTRTLSTTFSAGVPLVDALESVAGATGNIVYSTTTRKIRDDVTTGQQLNFAIKNTTLFTAMITQMVGIGEESGALDGMLDKCAVYYEAEVDNAVDGLTALMEPMIMGVLIGGLMIAMYLPIFQLGAVM